MLNYNTENNDYALMNYILGGVIMLVLLVSFSCYRKWTSENYNKGRVPLYDRLSFIYCIYDIHQFRKIFWSNAEKTLPQKEVAEVVLK